MKVLIADLFSQESINDLRANNVEVEYIHDLEGQSLSEKLRSFDPEVLVVRSTKVQQDQLDSGVSLKAVIRAGQGYDTIDIQYAGSKNIFVGNCPGMNSVAVAELIFGYILSVDRRIPENVQLLKEKQWNKGLFASCKGVKGQTIGLVGYGNIGKEVAVRALAFGMKVVVSDPRDSKTLDSLNGQVGFLSLEEVLNQSDIISLSVPYMESTKGMINKSFLSQMKNNATLINTSRGEIVNETELIEFLDSNKNFWYACDVYCGEPSGKKAEFDSKLAQHPRVYGTHHIGASTLQAEAAIGLEAYRMILEFDKTQVLPNVVNQKYL